MGFQITDPEVQAYTAKIADLDNKIIEATNAETSKLGVLELQDIAKSAAFVTATQGDSPDITTMGEIKKRINDLDSDYTRYKNYLDSLGATQQQKQSLDDRYYYEGGMLMIQREYLATKIVGGNNASATSISTNVVDYLSKVKDPELKNKLQTRADEMVKLLRKTN
jgi:hypothetical protein